MGIIERVAVLVFELGCGSLLLFGALKIFVDLILPQIRRWPRWQRVSLAVAALLFAYFLWPTPWRWATYTLPEDDPAQRG